jgi:hypothetical protein
VAVESLLPDELLQQVIAVGHVDVLVGVPTLNNAETIGGVVRAVHQGFARYFARDRTVLVNSDGGSEDGTRDIVRHLSLDDAGTLTVSHGLRTVHRISTPYHGVPGKGGAIRQILAVADLLQARTIVVLDPEVTSITPEWIPALVSPVRSGAYDFVAPIYARHPADGPLISQLVRPLVRAAYGFRVAEPLAAEFACSARFAADAFAQDVWDTLLAQYGIDMWVTGFALSAPSRCCQAALGPRASRASSPRPSLPALFGQVVGSLFACLELQAEAWLSRSGSQPLPIVGPPGAAAVEGTALDGEHLLKQFGAHVRDLAPILDAILVPETHDALVETAGAGLSRRRFADDLWAATVYQFLAAYHQSVMRREHITQALFPLYLGRAGSFLLEHAGASAAAIEADLEALAGQFERSKPYLVERWPTTSTR